MQNHLTYREIFQILKKILDYENQIRLTNIKQSTFNGLEQIESSQYIMKHNEIYGTYPEDNFSKIKEVYERGYLENPSFDGFNRYEDLRYLKIPSQGENFIEQYSYFFRKLEYDYKDRQFIGSLALGFIGGLIPLILIKIIELLFFTNK